MSSSRLVRGAKTRMFACVCLICLLGALVYVFHGTQARLADVQKMASDCNQQQESLSAQLQVIFEYKLRLEKSLKKEKADHDATKENCRAREKEDRELREKERTEAANKYDALLQQSKLQKSRLEDEKEELTKQVGTAKEEKKQLEELVQSLKDQYTTLKRNTDSSLENLKTDYLKLLEENKKLNDTNEELKNHNIPCDDRANHLEKQTIQLKAENQQLSKSLKTCEKKTATESTAAEAKKDVGAAPDTNALEAPKWIQSGNSSTTPGINPDALFSPEPSSQKPSDAQRKQDDQLGHPPKKATQENDFVGGGNMLGGVGQIPLPPEPLQQQQQQPEPQQQVLGPMNPMAGGNEERRGDAAIEEEDHAVERQ